MLLGHRSWVVVSCPAVLCVCCSLLSLSERRGDSNSVDNTFSCGLLASRLNCRMMGRYGPGRSNCIFLKRRKCTQGHWHCLAESTAFVCNPVLLLLLRQRLQRTTGDYGDLCSFLVRGIGGWIFSSHAILMLVEVWIFSISAVWFEDAHSPSLLPSQPNNTPKAQRDGHLLSAPHTLTHTHAETKQYWISPRNLFNTNQSTRKTNVIHASKQTTK